MTNHSTNHSAKPSSNDSSGPADTSMMRIVHTALRRDLDRARTALSAELAPDDAQRTAIGEQLRWLMRFLHRHHQGEDDGLYPLVRRKNPAAGALLDTMDADHQRITPAIEQLDHAAQAYLGAPSAVAQVLDAIDTLNDSLLPHLQREEDEMMPVVAATITAAEWNAWDQRYNVKPLPPLELADTGLWIIDDLGDDDQAVVERLVPAVPRWIIKNLLAGRYRRAAYRRWRLPQHASRRSARST